MRRIVITGIGLVTPLGHSTEDTWAATVQGQSGIGPITLFDTTDYATKFGGEVHGWDPTKYIEPREAKHLDRFVQFGVVAADLAIADAGLKLSEAESERAGVYIGAGLGGVATIEKTYKAILEKGPAPRRVAVLRPPDHRQHYPRTCLHPPQAARPVLLARVRLLVRCARHRRGHARHPARRRGRDGGRGL